MEALRYSAVIKANLASIGKELEKTLHGNPLIQLIATKGWWEYWLDKEDWQKRFNILLTQIKKKLRIEIECQSLKNITWGDICWMGPEKNIPHIHPMHLRSDPFNGPVFIGTDKSVGNRMFE